MEKLKTLKDLKTVKDLLWKVKAPLESGKMETLNHFVRIQELKQEAIKWVKWKLDNSDLRIIKIYQDGDDLRIDFKGTNRFSAGFIHSLIELHNITEDDLK